LCGW